MFYVQYGPEIPTSAVPVDMENAVRGVLNGLMMDNTNDLNELVVKDGFFISSVSAGVVPPAKLGCKFHTLFWSRMRNDQFIDSNHSCHF